MMVYILCQRCHIEKAPVTRTGECGLKSHRWLQFMKKLTIFLSVFLSLMVAHSALVVYHWNAVDNPVTAGGLPPKYLRVYYGPSLKNYTNHVDVLLTNINTTNTYHGWDQYNCVWVDVKNYVVVNVGGLVLSQQIYTAYSVINSNGVEGPLINEATCGFTVTNNSNGILPPANLRIVK